MPFIKKPAKKQQQKPRKWSNRQLRNKIYHSKEWRELRQWWIETHPLCQRCEREGRTTPATAVHHKESFAKYFRNGQITEKALEVAFNPSNLMSVCDACHKKEHNQWKKLDINDFMD